MSSLRSSLGDYLGSRGNSNNSAGALNQSRLGLRLTKGTSQLADASRNGLRSVEVARSATLFTRGAASRDGEGKLTFNHIISVLWRRKLLIVTCVVIAVLVAGAYVELKKPTYTATATVELTPAAVSGSGASTPSLPALADPSFAIDTTDVAKLAAKYLHETDPQRLVGAASVSENTQGNLIYVSASSKSSGRAVALSNAFAKALVAYAASEVQSQVLQMQREVNTYSREIANLQARLAADGGHNAALQIQITALSSDESSVLAQEASLANAGPQALVEQTAQTAYPSGISKKKLGAIALVIGLLVGAGVALVRDQLDTRVHGRPELEALEDLPVLGELPVHKDRKASTSKVAIIDQPHSVLAESVRDLRTSLQALLEDKPAALLMVTSPAPGDGKTFVAVNLAAAWALAGKQTLVVSADLRRPRLEAALGLASELPGLSQLASLDRSSRPPWAPTEDQAGPPTTEEISTSLQPTPLPSLRAIAAGSIPDNPAELLAGEPMTVLLTRLREIADVAIFDTPPVLSVTDACVLGSQVDGTIVVVSEGDTDRGALDRAIQRLTETGSRILGIVINRSTNATTSLYYPY